MAPRVTRREVLAAGAAAAAVGPLGGALAAPKTIRSASARPNVLFIAIDDMNDWTGWLGGYPGASTPNLDRLAGLATGFTRAYTPAPACQPGRTAILFGVEPYKSGVYTNKSAEWWHTPLADRTSLPRAFREAGYETIGTGKVFHSGWRGPRDNLKDNDPDAWTRYEFFSELLNPGDNNALEWGPQGQTETTEDVGRARFVASELSKSHDAPFFLAFGIRKPHMPWFVPQEFFDLYPVESLRYPLGALDTEHSGYGQNEDDKDLPPAGREMVEQHLADHRKILAGKGWTSAVQAYLAAISLADRAAGVALEALYAGPNASNTIVVVWSDHGWQLGEKLAWRKFTLWERATRAPVIIGGPGLRRGPSDALLSEIDLYPTLVDLCGIGGPEGLDGVSLAGHLRGEAAEPRDHVVSTWSLDVGDGTDREGKHFAVRSKTHRLIAYGNGDRELYDHRVDPYEWRNLLYRPNGASRASAADLERFVPKSAVAEVRTAGGAETD